MGLRSTCTSVAGVELVELEMHGDHRGHVTELFCDEWASMAGFVPRQWHMLACLPGALRGMHAHARHDDLKIVTAGSVTLALKDLRQGSPTEGMGDLMRLSEEQYAAVRIPAGVAHGVVADTHALVLVGVTIPYDGTDELQCAWDDPALGIDWPVAPTLVSERDRTAGTVAELLDALAPWQPLYR